MIGWLLVLAQSVGRGYLLTATASLVVTAGTVVAVSESDLVATAPPPESPVPEPTEIQPGTGTSRNWAGYAARDIMTAMAKMATHDATSPPRPPANR